MVSPLLSRTLSVRLPADLLSQSQPIQLPTVSEPSTNAVPSASSHALSAPSPPHATVMPSEPHNDIPRILLGIMERTYASLIDRLFVKAIPLPEGDAFYRVAQDLRAISASRASARSKLRQVCQVLTLLKTRLHTAEAQNNAPLRTLSTYLSAVLPWIEEADAQWLNVELTLADLSTSSHWTIKAIGALGQIERLLNLPALQSIARQPTVASCLNQVASVKQLLGKIHLLQTLPGEASLHDYLAVLVSAPEWPGDIGKALQPIVSTLSWVCRERPCPDHYDLQGQMQWLMDVLTTPELQEKVQPHLEMLLGNEDHAKQLMALLHLSQAMKRYPVDVAPTAQVLWLIRAVAESGVFACLPAPTQDNVIPSWPGFAWMGTLANDKSVLAIIEAMLTSELSLAGWSRLMKDVASASLPGVSHWMAGHAAKHAASNALMEISNRALQYVAGQEMSLHAYRELENFYRESASTETWMDMFTRLSTSLYRAVGPQVFESIFDQSGAASTLRYAEILQGHTDWTQTIQWLVAQDTSHDAVLTQLYSHYSTVLIVWQAYNALKLDDIEQSEAMLRGVAYKLHDAEIVRRFPQLGKLVDLLPLLPALRQIHAYVAKQPGDSLWDRAARWQEALMQADTPQAREAGERLAQCAVDWLVDAGMAACDHLASAAWSPGDCLARATGKPTDPSHQPSAENQAKALDAKASSTSQAPPTSLKPTTTTTAALPLTAGAGLGMIGAASLMYGLWQCTQTRKDYVLVGQTRLPTCARVMPFIAGATALTAAGLIVYPHIGDHSVASSADGVTATAGTSGAPSGCEPVEIMRLRQAYPDLAHAVDCLELPDWGRISKDLIDAANAQHRPVREVNQESFLDTGRASGKYSGTLVTEELQPTYIDLGIKGYMEENSANPAAQAQLTLMLNRVASEPYVLAGLSPEERATRKLLKLMQSVLEAARDFDVASDLATQSRLKEIWTVLYDLYTTARSGLYAEQVRSAGALFEITGELPFRGLAETDYVDSFVTSELVRESAEVVLKAYHPILDPAGYIHDYINAILAAYKFRTSRNLTADSLIEVTLRPVFLGDMDHVMKQAPRIKKEFSIRDIVLGQHHYVIDGMREGGTTYKIESMSESDLMNDFKKNDLQKKMDAALLSYRSNKVTVGNLKKFNRALIEQRCLWFLDRASRFPMFASAVKAFLSGESNARLLRFHSRVVNGGFCIAVSPSVLLILSADEPKFFYIFEKEFRYFSNNSRQSVMMPNFPDEFLDWVYSKIPIVTATRYHDREAARKNRYVALRFGGGLPALRRVDLMNAEAFHCSKPFAIGTLDDALTTAFLDRVHSDIDRMIFSEGEHAMAHLLDVINAALAFASLAAPLVLPGTGSLLTLTCSAVFNLGIATASAVTPALQMHISDRAADKEGYAFDAFVAIVLLALTARSDAFKILGALKTSTKELSHSIAAYRSVRKAFAPRFRANGLTVPRPMMAQEDFVVNRPSNSKSIIVPQGAPNAPRIGPNPPSGHDFQQLARSDRHFHYPISRTFKSVGMTITPGNETVGYRSIIGTEYVQLLTTPKDGMPISQSKNLVVSAVGGYLSSDLNLTSRFIAMPPRVTLQMLVPHDMKLLDPNIDVVINDPNFVAYLKISGEMQKVNFLPQSHANWLFGPGYDPGNVASTHGPVKGLMNYRHIQATEDQGALWRAIGRNRVLAEEGVVPRSDVLVMNDGIKSVWESNPNRASVAAVLDLDKRGLLVNAHGERYDTITFSHARSNFDRPEGLVAAHSPDFFNLAVIDTQNDAHWKRAVYRTTVSQDSHGDMALSSTVLEAAYLYNQPAEGSPVSTRSTPAPLSFLDRILQRPGSGFPGRG